MKEHTEIEIIEPSQSLPNQRRYKRFEAPSVQPEDINNILDMCISSLKGKPAKYEESPKGLEDFRQASIDYFEYLAAVNHDPQTENFLVPDIESWACFIGITRMTLLNYEKNRSQEWKDTIRQFKEAIASIKKQLAFRQKIPSVIAMFDLTNNHNYVNSNEFKISNQIEDTKPKSISLKDLPDLEEFSKKYDSEHGTPESDIDKSKKQFEYWDSASE